MKRNIDSSLMRKEWWKQAFKLLGEHADVCFQRGAYMVGTRDPVTGTFTAVGASAVGFEHALAEAKQRQQ